MSEPPFDVVAHVDGGSGVNEDRVGQARRAAWVLDGATGLTDDSFTDAASDGAWFVDRFDRALSATVTDVERSLSEIVTECIETVASDFAALVSEDDVDDAALPSGALALARWDETSLEYFVLGDCSLAVAHEDELVTHFGEGPRELDDEVVREMQSLLTEQGYSYGEAREAVSDTLAAHRRLKNEPDGYWTLGLEPDAVDHATIGSHPRSTIEDACLFSDGFEPIVETYDLFRDWGTAMDYVRENGPVRTVRILRAVEESDPNCTRYPRLKPSDDAGFVLLSRPR